MVGTRGKGKASSAKSKGKAPSVVSAVTEPVVAEESSQCPSAGENKIEIPSTFAKENDDQMLEIPSTDEKKNDDATPGVVGNGTEDNQQLANEGNDDEKSNIEENDHENSDDEQNDDENDVTDEMTPNEVDSLSEEPEEDNDEDEDDDDDDAANDLDPEDNGIDGEEDVEEDLSDDGGAVNNVDDDEDIEGKPDEEVEVEDKELINDCGGDENIIAGEKNKDTTEVAEDGKMVTDEGLAVSEHGLIDEMMNKEASVEPNTERPLSTPAGGETENMSIASDVKAPTEEAKKPKKKIIKKVIKRVRKKPQSAVVNDASGNGESVETNKNEINEEKAEINDASGNGKSAETNENEKSEEKAEIKQPVVANKKLNLKRKSGVTETNVGVAASIDGQKAEPSNIEQGTEVVKETDKVEVEGEKGGKLVSRSTRRSRNKRKQKAKKDEITANETTANVVVTGDTNKAGPSQKGKPKKVDSMGMIFMCSSETKKDCYNYKVLGLPANKKDFVSKVYQGMRLFLFDVQLRMLYGIYKASAPGGFNIEPRAFKSKYPSQVRFTVLEECVPLSEEKFKKVIKKNYYAKNKFNCKLSSMQVRDLCKLFRDATKAESTRTVRNPVEAVPSSAQRDKKKRKRTDEGPKARPAPPSKRDRRHTANRGDARRGPPPAAADDRYYQRSHPVVYEREAYLPPRAPPVQVVYQPLPPPSLPRPSSYSYGGPPRDDIYRHEPALERVPVIERRELSLRGPTEADRREPYSSYRDTRGAYLEPAYETSVRRDVYEPSARRDVYEPSARREHYDYTSDARRVEYYSSAADYRAPLPPYRRY